MIQTLGTTINQRILHRNVVIQLLVNIIKQKEVTKSLLCKELKIKSQIGVAHRKDKLTYFTLIHQINDTQKTGYKSGILSSVIRNMSPSLFLRNVLETTSNLSLRPLLQYLEYHLRKRVPQICVEN